MEDEAEIIPAPGRVKETARQLLNLADKPRHVRMNHDGGASFLVPTYLRDRYLGALAASTDAHLDPAGGSDVVRRRGRPPKPRPADRAISKDEE